MKKNAKVVKLKNMPRKTLKRETLMRETFNRTNMNKPSVYMFSKKLYIKNNKVIENITEKVKNNKLYIKGYVNGKKINKTNRLKSNNSNY